MKAKIKINFRPVGLDDKEIFEKLAKINKLKSCEFSFSNIFCWKELYDTKIAFTDNFLITRFNLNASSQLAYMDPLSMTEEPNYDKILDVIKQDCAQNSKVLQFFINTTEFLDYLKHNSNYAFYPALHLSDYIYDRANLEKLTGKKYQPKRNFINQFKAKYQFKYQEISSSNIDTIRDFATQWYSTKNTYNNTLNYEKKALINALDNFQKLDLRGGILWADDQPVAFTLGSALNESTFCIHFEKAIASVKGAYTTINQLFVDSLPDNFTHINREEDMGIEGLRKAKMSYHPVGFHVKYQLKELTALELDCRALWIKVFGDNPRVIDQFMINYFTEDLCFRAYDKTNTSLCSMFFVVPFESQYGKTAYIYAVATQEQARRQGYATQLLESALFQLRAQGYQLAALIASNQENEAFYSKFGFQLASSVEFSTIDGFDFHDKGEAQDRVMILNLANIEINPEDKLSLSSTQHLKLI